MHFEANVFKPKARVLLLAEEPAASSAAASITAHLGAEVTTVAELERANELLLQERFTLVLLEETVMLDQPAFFESLSEAAGGALVLDVNFGILSAPRVAQQVRFALERRGRMEERAMKAVMLSLRNELGASLSGLLLESQLALRTAGPELAPSLQHMVDLAEALSQQLRT